MIRLKNIQFNRMELAGAFGDLGTLLPIVIGMILINKLSPTAVFLFFGLFYIFSGFYYKLPVPVQPLKAVGAIAIAYPDQITEPVIAASGIIFGGLFLVLSLSGLVDRLARLFTQPVVRGIQLGLGLIFLKKGVELILAPRLFVSDPDKSHDCSFTDKLGFVAQGHHKFCSCRRTDLGQNGKTGTPHKNALFR